VFLARAMAQSPWVRLREFDPNPAVLSTAEQVKQVRFPFPLHDRPDVEIHISRGHPVRV
jgi:hypothetical protein